MAELLESEKDVRLVEAGIWDYEFFYRLKCGNEQLKWGGFAEKPDYNRLQQWFQNELSYQSKIILIIYWKEEKVGCISFSVHGHVCDNHSTAVESKWSGLGIGALALKKNEGYLKQHYPDCTTIIGWVRTDNIASRKMLTRCGWSETEEYLDKFFKMENKVIKMQKWIRSLNNRGDSCEEQTYLDRR